MEREYTVIANTREDLPALEAEITASSGAGPIPNRSVDVANPRPGSKIQTHFMLTDAEAQALCADPRVRAVEIPPDQRDDISIGLNASQRGVFARQSGLDSSYVNWGLRRCVSETNNYVAADVRSTTVDGPYEYGIDGTGVDVVIQDSGIDPDHPDWNDASGTSRLQQIDWYTESGVVGTQSQDHYRDLDGHGSHCASIAAGLLYGWAKGAQIYSQKLAGLETLQGSDGTGISISDAFDCIRLWHTAKTNGRPTVVNMSWGYGANVTGDPTSGAYRGTAWTWGVDYTNRAQLMAATGVSQNFFSGGTSHRIPVRVESVDAEVDDMILDGIHVCIAAGNNLHKVDLPPTQTNTFSGEGQFGSALSQYGALRVNGNLAVIGETRLDRARVFNLDTGQVVYTLTDPGNGGQYGRVVDISDTWIVVTDLNAGTSNSGEVYVYNRSTGALQHTLVNPNAFGTAAGDVFGSKVAISGNMIAVQASAEDDANGLSSGKVYVFDLGSVTPTTVLYTLDNPNNDGGTTQSDGFGGSLAIDGDNLVVGTPADDTNSTNSGVVYVYDLGSVTPTTPRYVIENPNAYDTSASDLFGSSADISGDLIIVGAVDEDDASGISSGKAYIFNLSNGSLLHTLNNPNASGTSDGDEFSTAVSISNGRCLVGAPFEGVGGSFSGSVYMFNANTGSLLYTFVNPGHPDDTTVAGDRFGDAVSIDGNRIAIGAYSTVINGVNQTGAAYSYTIGLDYDNEVTFGGTSRTYHRGSSPYSLNAFMVGNIDSGAQNSNGATDNSILLDQTSSSTTRGPGVNIFAPGTDIMAATSTGYDTGSYSVTGYPGTPGFPIMSISGTSMASPQVCGVVAQHLQVFPNLTPAQMQARIFNDSKSVLFTTNSDTDYERIYDSLMGAPNRMLYSRYGKQAITVNTVDLLEAISVT